MTSIRLPYLFLVALSVFAGACGDTVTPPDLPVPPKTFVPTASGRGGAAATVDVRGTWAAIRVLQTGGNAVDAAVAAAGTLGVTDPFSCGVGGGGFMLIYLAGSKQVVAIDHRETTPGKMSSGSFYENGAVIPFNDLVTSGLSVGVPGTVSGWDEALRRFGTRSFADVLGPAIQVAEQGFDVDQTFFDQTQRNLARFQQLPPTAALYLTSDGKPLPVGALFKNPDLAKTYRALAKDGAAAFYTGPIAQAIVDTVQRPPVAQNATLKVRPGLMELSDLAGYQARLRTPVATSYRGRTIYGMGLPSSGGLTVGMTLNLLDGYDTKSLSPTEVLHRYLEASRLAYADRNAFMADPEFVSVAVKGMLSPDYATERRKLIDLTKAATMPAAAGNPSAFQSDPSGQIEPAGAASALALDDPETTHIVVSDRAGNVVSYTCTIESEGGNGMVVAGYGFLLNNELTDFNMPASPMDVHPNVLEPGKRPRSSISPTLVFEGDKLVLALGSPGGSTIITTVLQILVNHLDLGMPIDAALAAPRVSQRNTGDTKSNAEPAFLTTPEVEGLKMLGHMFVDSGPIGAATAIRFNADGTVTAAAEPTRRNGGSAMVTDTP